MTVGVVRPSEERVQRSLEPFRPVAGGEILKRYACQGFSELTYGDWLDITVWAGQAEDGRPHPACDRVISRLPGPHICFAERRWLSVVILFIRALVKRLKKRPQP